MRYHFFPFLIPKHGQRYELTTTRDANLSYTKEETSWRSVLKALERPWYRRGRKQEWISWEIVATTRSIRYFVWVPDTHIGQTFQNNYYAEHPEVEMVEVANPSLDFTRPHAGMKLYTDSHWTVPIKTYQKEAIDTQAELIELLETLEDGQEIHLRFLLQPAYRTEKDFRGITKQLHEEGIADASLQKDNELYLTAIEGKARQKLAWLEMKAVAFGSTTTEAQTLMKRVRGSVGRFSSGRLNQLNGREWWWFRTNRPLFRWEFQHRLFSMERKKNRVILGTEEMAALLRLPSEQIQHSKLNRLNMRSTPFPKELQQEQEPSRPRIPLGIHCYHGRSQEVPYDLANLRHHTAILGMTGMGKSTLMVHLIEGLIKQEGSQNTLGGTVIDPHGDLCQDIAARIPPEKQHAIRYIKFAEGDFPFNLFHMDFAITEDKIAQTVVDVLKRTWQEFWGPNIDDNLLNGGIAIQRVKEANLANLQRLLSDAVYRKALLEQLDQDDPLEKELYQFFSDLQDLNKREHQFKTNSTLNKLRKVTLSGVLGPMLQAKTNGLSFRESMDQGKITLLDLSELTNDEKKLIGSICLTMAELAGRSRADTPKPARDKLPHHFVLVDEAPSFMEHSATAIDAFASELRKYKVSIILGIQGLKGQLPDDMVDAIFRNVGTLMAFRLGNPADAHLIHQAMPSEILSKQDYLTIEPYHAYTRLQVGMTRTQPFPIHITEPVPIKRPTDLSAIRRRTLEEAMEREHQAGAAASLAAKDAPMEAARWMETQEKGQGAFDKETGDDAPTENLPNQEQEKPQEKQQEVSIEDALF
ncbi:ATP-binding protein [Thalassobacillus pellis]|uniref:ATP-binding protein n=1 Tax=Thalassobacillus pellis TaxID=748008 RepID=UPI00195FFFB8|nr:DUF87 domain-containing protein [Thalassobacillus pellis]MBM7554577.1 energy-coupling factor transporter ATP-binding protein EcfA2 [Thalassobacillus pellis]